MWKAQKNEPYGTPISEKSPASTRTSHRRQGVQAAELDNKPHPTHGGGRNHGRELRETIASTGVRNLWP